MTVNKLINQHSLSRKESHAGYEGKLQNCHSDNFSNLYHIFQIDIQFRKQN
jgi:hypothetical protein